MFDLFNQDSATLARQVYGANPHVDPGPLLQHLNTVVPPQQQAYGQGLKLPAQLGQGTELPQMPMGAGGAPTPELGLHAPDPGMTGLGNVDPQTGTLGAMGGPAGAGMGSSIGMMLNGAKMIAAGHEQGKQQRLWPMADVHVGPAMAKAPIPQPQAVPQHAPPMSIGQMMQRSPYGR